MNWRGPPEYSDSGKGCGGEALEGRRRYSHAVCWGSASRQAVAGYRPGEKFLNLDPSAGMLNKTTEAAGPHKMFRRYSPSHSAELPFACQQKGTWTIRTSRASSDTSAAFAALANTVHAPGPATTTEAGGMTDLRRAFASSRRYPSFMRLWAYLCLGLKVLQVVVQVVAWAESSAVSSLLNHPSPVYAQGGDQDQGLRPISPAGSAADRQSYSGDLPFADTGRRYKALKGSLSLLKRASGPVNLAQQTLLQRQIVHLQQVLEVISRWDAAWALATAVLIAELRSQLSAGQERQEGLISQVSVLEQAQAALQAASTDSA
ncbi:hypothetical protein WJX82_000864 [Trebouxia sp. C0006]